MVQRIFGPKISLPPKLKEAAVMENSKGPGRNGKRKLSEPHKGLSELGYAGNHGRDSQNLALLALAPGRSSYGCPFLRARNPPGLRRNFERTSSTETKKEPQSSRVSELIRSLDA